MVLPACHWAGTRSDSERDCRFVHASTNAVTISQWVPFPAPEAVYQSERRGNFSYTFNGLPNGATYAVRMHFAELVYTAAGQRLFNVSINGTQVLSNFDIFATAGGAYKAVCKAFRVVPTAGTITVQYTGVKNAAKSSGIQVVCVIPAPAAAPSAATALSAAVVTDDTTTDNAGTADDVADSPIDSIDLGSVQVGRRFKLPLETPDEIPGQKARWSAVDHKHLPPGVSVSNGIIGGKPVKPGTYQFVLEFEDSGGHVNVKNTYKLVIAP